MSIINLNDKKFDEIKDTDIIDLRNIKQINSVGNLIKWVFIPNDKRRNELHIKTGKLIGSNNINNLKFGIEPIVELLSYELCNIMNLSVANERINLALINYKNKEILTIVNISEDFKGKKDMEHIHGFIDFNMFKKRYLKNSENLNYRNLINILKEYEKNKIINIDSRDSEVKIIQMIIFDYIILNTDRHYKNFGYLHKNSNNMFKFSPLYDHGQSLLYDVNLINLDYNNAELYESHLKTTEFNNYFYSNLNEAERLIYNNINIYGNKKREIEDYIEFDLEMNLTFSKEELKESINNVYKSYNNILNLASHLSIPNDVVRVIPFINNKWFTFITYIVYNRTNNILNGFSGKYNN